MARGMNDIELVKLAKKQIRNEAALAALKELVIAEFSKLGAGREHLEAEFIKNFNAYVEKLESELLAGGAPFED